MTSQAEWANLDYVYKHVTPHVLSRDMAFTENAPGPGDRLPRFVLPSADGRRVRTDDMIDEKPVLMVTASLTCPMTASSNPLLKRLHARFGSRVHFIMLHVREAHPGEFRDQPRTHDEKIRHANNLKARDDLPWPVAVDDLPGTVHRALDEKPNAAYLADRNGRIVFRALWAGDVRSLEEALESVVRGERPRDPESHRRLFPMAQGLGIMRETLQHSGARAERDIWQSAPPMAAVAWLAHLFRPLPPHWRTFAAATTIGIGIAAVAIAAVRTTRGKR